VFPALRFTVCAVLSVVLMYYDQHGHWEQRLRYALEAAAYPVQVVVNSPSAVWRSLLENFQSRSVLRAENERLRAHERELELSLMREAALEQENAELRQLRAALPPPLIKKALLAEIISVETDPLRFAGFRAVLESQSDLQLTAVSLSEIGATKGIDVVLVGGPSRQDILNRVEALKAIRADLQIMVTGSDISDDFALNALVCGAKGYIDEAAPVQELAKAIRIDGIVMLDCTIIEENGI